MLTLFGDAFFLISKFLSIINDHNLGYLDFYTIKKVS